MNTFKSSILAIVMVMIMGVAGQALAEDFVFTVPLELQNLHPEINKALVKCEVSDKSGKLIGVGSKVIPVGPNGTLSKDVDVAFNTYNKHLASDATQYKCYFRLMRGVVIYAPTQKDPKTYPYQWVKPGTPLVTEVSGPIPLPYQELKKQKPWKVIQ